MCVVRSLTRQPLLSALRSDLAVTRAIIRVDVALLCALHLLPDRLHARIQRDAFNAYQTHALLRALTLHKH